MNDKQLPDATFEEWCLAISYIREDNNLDLLKRLYPYLVTAITPSELVYDCNLKEWLDPLGYNMVLVYEDLADRSWRSTLALRHEKDAIAFKLRFACE